jgi:hypothetical protein
VPSIPDEIERVALLGWHVYPHSRHGRAGCFEGAHAAASCDLDTIAAWCRDFPACNWRVVFGPSGLIGFDCDVPPIHLHDGIAALADLVSLNSPLPLRPTLRSGGGGLAIIFRDTGVPIVGSGGKPAPGIDPRRGRQSQTIPPSTHHSTRQAYRWLAAPWETPLPPAPDWLLDLVRPPPVAAPAAPAVLRTGDQARNYAIGALKNAVRRVAVAGSGNRNNALNAECFSVARFVNDGSLTESEVRQALFAAAQANGVVAEDGPRAALLTIDSGLKSRRSA